LLASKSQPQDRLGDLIAYRPEIRDRGNIIEVYFGILPADLSGLPTKKIVTLVHVHLSVGVDLKVVREWQVSRSVADFLVPFNRRNYLIGQHLHPAGLEPATL
jgi:hypothetical protein